MRRGGIAVLTFAFGAMALGAFIRPGCAQSVAEFYRGRNVTLVIGFSVGGGYDLYGRLLARHLGKHIPGQPSIVPQNREGAGSERAILYLYNAAPKDGSVIGTFSRSMAIAPLVSTACRRSVRCDQAVMARQHLFGRERVHDVAYVADQDIRRHAGEAVYDGRPRQGGGPGYFCDGAA